MSESLIPAHTTSQNNHMALSDSPTSSFENTTVNNQHLHPGPDSIYEVAQLVYALIDLQGAPLSQIGKRSRIARTASTA